MNILVPAALAFAAIIPIILILYLMRPKRQERTVGSTLLWLQALQDLQASRPWQRLRVTPLLLLQLLAAIVIVLVLARPAIFASSPLSGDTIIVLQASASMQATDVAPDRFEAAKSRISDFIDNMGPGDHLSLLTMARTPQMLLTESQDKAQLHAALERAKVTNQDADLAQALSFATSLVAGRSNVQVLVVGDGHVLASDQKLTLPFAVRFLRIGTDAPNVALLSLAARAIQGKLVALAQVANYSHQTRSIPVELYADGHLVGVQTAALPPGASSSVQWNTLPSNTRFLHAKLISQDAMTIDHEAWALAGGSLHGRVLLVTKGNSFLEAALRSQPTVTLFEITPDHYNQKTLYDLTVFDGFVPSQLPSGNLLFLNPPPGRYLFGTVGPQIHVSHLAADHDRAGLLQYVDLSTIHTLQASHQLTPATWADAVLSSPETPLLLSGETDNRRVAVFGFDLHDSDLPLQPAFPFLIYNLVNWFLPQPVAGNGQVPAGLPVTVQTWPGAQQVTITGPDQQATTVGPPFPVNPYDKTNQTGIYTVTQKVQGHNLAGAFAVNLFDASQSNLAPAKSLPVTNSTDLVDSGNQLPRELREVWPWIAAFLLLVLCLEWWLFSRGYRTQQQASSKTHKPASPAAPTTPLARAWQRLAHAGSEATQPYARTLKRLRRNLQKRTRAGSTSTTHARTSSKRKQSKGGRRVHI